MEENIIKVLKENNLYDKYNPLKNNSINKPNEFFKTYKINPTNKSRLPNNIIRDDKKRIILDEIPFVASNITVEGRTLSNWLILNNGTKILIKNNINNKNNTSELLLMYFIKLLNVSCANYDIGILNDKEYLISINFLKNKERIFEVFKNVPSIDKGYEKLKTYGSDIHFLKTCFIDNITGNIDRFPKNFGVIVGGKYNFKTIKGRICPLYDNADINSLFFREDKFGFCPSIGKTFSNPNEIFNYLLSYEQINAWVNSSFKKANLYNAAQMLYKEKNIYVDSGLYDMFETFFKDSESIINEELKGNCKIKLV